MVGSWDVDESFPEVPLALVTDCDWEVTGQQGWRLPIITHIGEVRAANEALGRELVRGRLSEARLLRVGDNLGAVLALERCRSASYALLKQVRYSSAMQLGAGVRVSDRWTPSELNPTDLPSRDRENALTSVRLPLAKVCLDASAASFGSIAAARLQTAAAALWDGEEEAHACADGSGVVEQRDASVEAAGDPEGQGGEAGVFDARAGVHPGLRLIGAMPRLADAGGSPTAGGSRVGPLIGLPGPRDVAGSARQGGDLGGNPAQQRRGVGDGPGPRRVGKRTAG